MGNPKTITAEGSTLQIGLAATWLPFLSAPAAGSTVVQGAGGWSTAPVDLRLASTCSSGTTSRA